jgi:hydrogenase maturation protease
MARVQVIGFGNPLRGDDALGWQAVGELAGRQTCPDIDLMTCHQLTPELADPLSQAELAIFIDARADLEPGRFSCEPMFPAKGQESSFSHRLDIPALLACTESLYGRSPRAFLLSIGACAFGFGETLSAPVRAALPSLLGQVDRLVVNQTRLPSREINRRSNRKTNGCL